MTGADSGLPAAARWACVALIALLYLGVPNARPDFTRFNAHDSESYLALAHSLANGRGYTRSFDADRYVPHKTWPPGVPVLLMPAMAISGTTVNWTLAKGSMIAVGLLGGLFAWLLTWRVTRSRLAADLAAALLLMNGFYWDFSHVVMAEVPATAWVLFALWLCDKVLAGRTPSLVAAFLTGFTCGFGMLIKGHLLGLGLAVFAHAIGPRSMIGSGWRKSTVVATFGLAFILPFAAWSSRNAAFEAPGWDGVSQVRQVFTREGASDSTFRSPMETVSAIVSTLRTHAIYRVPEQMVPFLGMGSALDWPGSGAVAALLTLCIAAASVPLSLRRHYLGLFLVVAPLSALNLLFSTGGAARYWVPVSCLLLVTLVIRNYSLLQAWFGNSGRARVRVWGAVLLLAAGLVAYVWQHERRPYNQLGPWAELAELMEKLRSDATTPSAVLTPNNHAFQLITGKRAPMVGYSPAEVFDYMVGRVDGAAPRVPADALTIVEVTPWRYVRLRSPMSAAELLGPGDHTFGIPMAARPTKP